MANPDLANPEGFKVDHVRFRYPRRPRESLTIEHLEDSTIQTVLDDIAIEVYPNADLDIFFLPPIHAENDHGGPVLSSYPDLCQKLATALHVEPSFLTRDAWNSNGFFMTHSFQPQHTTGVGYSTASRFLVKFLPNFSETSRTPDQPEATWQRLSFCSMWFPCHSPRYATCILVCFDDCKNIKTDIVEGCRNYSIQDITAHHLAMHDTLLRGIIWKYDQSVSGLQKHIHDTGKRRYNLKAKVRDLEEQNRQDMNWLINGYEEMCGLSRQAGRVRETLQTATETMQTIARSTVTSQWTPYPYNIRNGLNSSICFLNNLNLRLDALMHSLDLEIKSVDTIVSMYHLRSTGRLLKEFKDDGKDTPDGHISDNYLVL
ncbi:hypothetical protein GGS26DRAFT_567331 [Hypomontagnella submonticulosa]|nr:hypothetical protein GGS26DRAFT_567331 [Hypomontagnella submonticulosa]